MFADGLGKQVTIAEAQETGALGAAIGAACGTGIYDGYETAVAAMSRPKASFTPNPNMQEHYDRRYAVDPHHASHGPDLGRAGE